MRLCHPISVVSLGWSVLWVTHDLRLLHHTSPSTIHISYLILHISHLKPDTWHLNPQPSPLTPHTSHITLHIPPNTLHLSHPTAETLRITLKNTLICNNNWNPHHQQPPSSHRHRHSQKKKNPAQTLHPMWCIGRGIATNPTAKKDWRIKDCQNQSYVLKEGIWTRNSKWRIKFLFEYETPSINAHNLWKKIPRALSLDRLT